MSGDRFTILRVSYLLTKLELALLSQQKPRPLFVDVGANLGWLAALAAHWGCRVIAFEPQVISLINVFKQILTFAAAFALVLANDICAQSVGQQGRVGACSCWREHWRSFSTTTPSG